MVGGYKLIIVKINPRFYFLVMFLLNMKNFSIKILIFNFLLNFLMIVKDFQLEILISNASNLIYLNNRKQK